MTINAFAHAMSDEDLIRSIKEGAGESLTVLLVEDEKSQALLIAALLERYGHTVHMAYSGEQAVEMFRQVRPDLVLMDVIMPGMDGYEATKTIRAEHKEWVPIIFLTGLSDETDRLYALKVGGDDFFSKPVDPAVLLAKMNVMGRIHTMQKQLKEYRSSHEEEDEITSLVMNRYLDMNQNDPRVEYSIESASNHFSGDAISVTPTPDGGLNVMMVDAMGHGLHAAINVLPALQAFSSMSKKGMSLDIIISEINDKVRELSMPGNFLAGTFLHLDSAASELTGWIGGTPKIYLNREGEMQSFRSSNLSLGILPSSKLDFEYFSAPWSDKSVLLTCTDGILESRGVDGEDLGEGWVCDVVKKYGNTLDKTIFDQVWKENLGSNKPHDDASVLIINQGGFKKM